MAPLDIAFLRLRGQKLYQGVLNLVYGDAGLTEALFSHPLLTSGSDDHALEPRTDERPSYVDARNFSPAFWQICALVNVRNAGGKPKRKDQPPR